MYKSLPVLKPWCFKCCLFPPPHFTEGELEAEALSTWEPPERKGGWGWISRLPMCIYHAIPFNILKIIKTFLTMLRYLANLTYMSYGLLLSNKITFTKYFKNSEYMILWAVWVKHTLEGNFVISESESASVKIQCRFGGLCRVPGRSLGSSLFFNQFH